MDEFRTADAGCNHALDNESRATKYAHHVEFTSTAGTDFIGDRR